MHLFLRKICGNQPECAGYRNSRTRDLAGLLVNRKGGQIYKKNFRFSQRNQKPYNQMLFL
jgi:hypothetical protein